MNYGIIINSNLQNFIENYKGIYTNFFDINKKKITDRNKVLDLLIQWVNNPESLNNRDQFIYAYNLREHEPNNTALDFNIYFPSIEEQLVAYVIVFFRKLTSAFLTQEYKEHILKTFAQHNVLIKITTILIKIPKIPYYEQIECLTLKTLELKKIHVALYYKNLEELFTRISASIPAIHKKLLAGQIFPCKELMQRDEFQATINNLPNMSTKFDKLHAVLKEYVKIHQGFINVIEDNEDVRIMTRFILDTYTHYEKQINSIYTDKTNRMQNLSYFMEKLSGFRSLFIHDTAPKAVLSAVNVRQINNGKYLYNMYANGSSTVKIAMGPIEKISLVYGQIGQFIADFLHRFQGDLTKLIYTTEQYTTDLQILGEEILRKNTRLSLFMNILLPMTRIQIAEKEALEAEVIKIQENIDQTERKKEQHIVNENNYKTLLCGRKFMDMLRIYSDESKIYDENFFESESDIIFNDFRSLHEGPLFFRPYDERFKSSFTQPRYIKNPVIFFSQLINIISRTMSDEDYNLFLITTYNDTEIIKRIPALQVEQFETSLGTFLTKIIKVSTHANFLVNRVVKEIDLLVNKQPNIPAEGVKEILKQLENTDKYKESTKEKTQRIDTMLQQYDDERRQVHGQRIVTKHIKRVSNMFNVRKIDLIVNIENSEKYKEKIAQLIPYNIQFKEYRLLNKYTYNLEDNLVLKQLIGPNQTEMIFLLFKTDKRNPLIRLNANYNPGITNTSVNLNGRKFPYNIMKGDSSTLRINEGLDQNVILQYFKENISIFVNSSINDMNFMLSHGSHYNHYKTIVQNQLTVKNNTQQTSVDTREDYFTENISKAIFIYDVNDIKKKIMVNEHEYSNGLALSILLSFNPKNTYKEIGNKSVYLIIDTINNYSITPF